jgi:hypothetical protein
LSKVSKVSKVSKATKVSTAPVDGCSADFDTAMAYMPLIFLDFVGSYFIAFQALLAAGDCHRLNPNGMNCPVLPCRTIE